MFGVFHRRIFVILAIMLLLITAMSGVFLSQSKAGTSSESAAPDVVMEWNMAMLDMIKAKNISNHFGNRAMAMVHVAMFDAINGIQPKYTQFAVSETQTKLISPQVAAATAAYTILTALYPAEQPTFETLYQEQLSRLSDNPGLRRLAVQYGEQIAKAVLELRQNDGSAQAASVPYPDGTKIGEWRRTAPGMMPMLPGWGQVTPFAMTSVDQFRLIGNPAMDSYEYARDYNEVKIMGAKNSTVRTSEQTIISRFWISGIPRMWNLVAREVVQQNQYDLIESARLFALLNVTLADANVMA